MPSTASFDRAQWLYLPFSQSKNKRHFVARAAGRVIEAMERRVMLSDIPSAPDLLMAAANDRAHVATLTWDAEKGEEIDEFWLEFRPAPSEGGDPWTIGAEVSSESQGSEVWSGEIAGLRESTGYEFQVRAVNSFGVSDPSNLIEAETAAFKMHDAFPFWGKPNLQASHGLQRASFADDFYSTDQYGRLTVNSEVVRNGARDAALRGEYYLPDIEPTPPVWLDERDTTLPGTPTSIERVDWNIEKLIDVVEAIDEGYALAGHTEYKTGFWGLLPLGPGSANLDNSTDVAAWREANRYLQPVADVVDFIQPVAYTDGHTRDVGHWAGNAEPFIREAGIFGKPVYPAISPHNEMRVPDRWAYLEAPFQRLMLETIRYAADGVVVWTQDDHPPLWDASIPWIDTTLDFALETPQPAPVPPSATTVHNIGRRVVWTHGGADTSAYLIERSKNGGAFRVVGATTADQRSWADTDLGVGQILDRTYRVSAINAWGASDSSTIGSFTGLRSAAVLNEAEQFNASGGPYPPQQFGSVVSVMQSGSWIRFDDVYFEDDASHFLAALSLPNGLQERHLQIWLDGVPETPSSTFVGEFRVRSSSADANLSGFNEPVPQGMQFSTPIDGGPGVTHDVYLYIPWDVVIDTTACYVDWFQFGNGSLLAAPRFMSTTSGSNGVTISWRDFNHGEGGFRIHRTGGRTGPVDIVVGPHDEQPGSVPYAARASYTDTTAVEDVLYTYEVYAMSATDESARSNRDRGVVDPTPATDRTVLTDFDEAAGLPHLVKVATPHPDGYNAWFPRIQQFDSGDWVRFRGVDFGSEPTMMTAYLRNFSHANPSIEFWIDAPDAFNGGTQIGTFRPYDTGEPNDLDREMGVQMQATGTHDLYIKGGGSGEFGLAYWWWFEFDGESPALLPPTNLHTTSENLNSISFAWNTTSQTTFLEWFDYPSGQWRHVGSAAPGIGQITLTGDFARGVNHKFRLRTYVDTEFSVGSYSAPGNEVIVYFEPIE